MKLLQDFTKNGFYYEQIKREGNLAIYKQRLRKGVGCLAYEVIVIRQNAATVLKGKTVPAWESCPSNEDFGRLGWTFPSLEAANAKFATHQASGKGNAQEGLEAAA